jgi:hypothetical protein
LGQSLPPQVPELLRQLNHELKNEIIAVLNDPQPDSPAEESMVTDDLKAAGWGDIFRSKWSSYGEITDIDFELQAKHDPPLLVVDTELWVPCGGEPNSTLYVFQKTGKNWEPVLTAESDYDSAGYRPDDALRYSVSPPDQNGKWFLGIANMPPHCPGNPQEVRFRILRPGPSPDQPAILIDRREPLNPGFDVPFDINIDRDKFSITLGKQRRLDGALGISISRFDVQGSKVSRVPPLALRPEDFLDEWVKRDWAEIAPWSNPSGGTALQEWHSKLQALAPDSTEMEFVQPCSNRGRDESAWQVGLWIDDQQNHNSPNERLYIAISKKAGAYYVEGIETNRPPGCAGDTRPSMLRETKLPS